MFSGTRTVDGRQVKLLNIIDEYTPHWDAEEVVMARLLLVWTTSQNREQQQLHFKNEKDGRRRKILKTIGETNTKSVIYIAEEKNDVTARYKCISQLVKDVSDLGASRLILESRESQNKRDHDWIVKARRETGQHFTFAHESPRTEPLLWVPDAVAWAHGKKRGLASTTARPRTNPPRETGIKSEIPAW